MRFKLRPETKDNTMTLAIAGVIVVVFFFTIQNIPGLLAFIKQLFRILMPFVVGFSLAFLITPLMLRIENQWLRKLKLSFSSKRKISAFLTMVISIGLFSLFIYIIIPQVLDSLNQISTQLPLYIEAAETYLNDLFLGLNIRDEITEILVSTGEELLSTITNLLREYLPMLLSASWQVVNTIFKVLVGLIITVYILLDRERFGNQFKKLTYAFLHEKDADNLLYLSRVTSKTFNSFIVGKSIDSLIIGVLSFIGMTIFGWPFAVLISVIIGVTNMIPVFGPFIGAVPGFIILFIVNPMVSFWFLLFVLFLQQLDGNIIGPTILGDSVGLPSLWIMFSILVGGGFFGVVGMFLGVPVFAVIYLIVKNIAQFKLDQKGIKIDEK